MVDVALRDCLIDPQLAPSSLFQPVSQDDNEFKQAVQRLGLNQFGPFDERCIIRHRVQTTRQNCRKVMLSETEFSVF